MSGKRAVFLRAAAALTATALPMRGGAQTGAALTPLRLGATVADDNTPILYAQKFGIFEKHGLAVELLPMSSGSASVAGLLAGSFDLGKSSVTSILDAHEKGLPLTLVAAAVIYTSREPFAAFLVRKESALRTGKDFNGQLVAVSALGDIGFLALQMWVDRRGGDSKSIKFVEIPLTAAAAALETGRVAAAESSFPALQVALESGKFRALHVDDALGEDYLLGAWATTRDFSAKHPQVIRSFARAYTEAATYTNAHHRETAPMMAAYTGIAEEVIARMPRATAGTAISAAQLQPVIDAEVKYGLLKARFAAAEMLDPNVG